MYSRRRRSSFLDVREAHRGAGGPPAWGLRALPQDDSRDECGLPFAAERTVVPLMGMDAGAAGQFVWSYTTGENGRQPGALWRVLEAP